MGLVSGAVALGCWSRGGGHFLASHIFWRSIWHRFWHSVWHQFSHFIELLSELLSDILSDTCSDILSDIDSDILSDINSDTLSDINFGILSDILSDTCYIYIYMYIWFRVPCSYPPIEVLLPRLNQNDPTPQGGGGRVLYVAPYWKSFICDIFWPNQGGEPFGSSQNRITISTTTTTTTTTNPTTTKPKPPHRTPQRRG